MVCSKGGGGGLGGGAGRCHVVCGKDGYLWSVVRVVSTMWYVVGRAVGRLLKRWGGGGGGSL